MTECHSHLAETVAGKLFPMNSLMVNDIYHYHEPVKTTIQHYVINMNLNK